jgi:hypothetical protein
VSVLPVTVSAMTTTPLTALADDPAGRLLGLDLPSGRLLDAALVEAPAPTALLWRADAQATPGDWARLASASAGTGLTPLLLRGDCRESLFDPDWAGAPEEHRAAEVLAEWWEWSVPEGDCSQLLPYGPEWPGMAPARPPARPSGEDPARHAAQLADTLTGEGDEDVWHLALVPVDRPADVPARLGWTGPANVTSQVARISCVLRSWEDRFGARLVALEEALHLSVPSPPQSYEEALPLAAEQFAFCADTVYQGAGDLEVHADELVGCHHWICWWD